MTGSVTKEKVRGDFIDSLLCSCSADNNGTDNAGINNKDGKTVYFYTTMLIFVKENIISAKEWRLLRKKNLYS